MSVSLTNYPAIEFPDYRRKKEPFDLGSLGQMSRSLGSNVPKPFPIVAFPKIIFCYHVWGRYVKAFSSYWSETVLVHLTLVALTFDPVTPKSIEFICYPGRMCEPSLKKVGQGIGTLLIGNGFGIFGTFDPGDLDIWPSEPRCWSETKRLQTDLPTDRPTDTRKAICPLLFERGHTMKLFSNIFPL